MPWIDSRPLLAPGIVLRAAGLILFHHQSGEAPWLNDRDVEPASLSIRTTGTTGVAAWDLTI